MVHLINLGQALEMRARGKTSEAIRHLLINLMGLGLIVFIIWWFWLSDS